MHQDFWFWREARPLVFGFLPIGLFYHAAYTLALSVLLWLLVRTALAGATRRNAPRPMIPAAVVFAYLGVVLLIGIVARNRSGGADAEDYFLAGRSLGPAVFLLSLFGANMTAFSILGASGHAFANGIVTYGLMASSSALIIPLSLFVIGTRLWALGKRHGFMTPVQMFRDRWECGHIGTVIFAVQAVLLVPYIVIAVMGGGTTLRVRQRRAGPVLARRRGRVARGDELRLLRRDARHRLGERVPDGAVPVVRRDRRRR